MGPFLCYSQHGTHNIMTIILILPKIEVVKNSLHVGVSNFLVDAPVCCLDFSQPTLSLWWWRLAKHSFMCFKIHNARMENPKLFVVPIPWYHVIVTTWKIKRKFNTSFLVPFVWWGSLIIITTIVIVIVVVESLMLPIYSCLGFLSQWRNDPNCS